jgi:hypothetical protein
MARPRLRAARHGVSYRYLFMHPSDRVFSFGDSREAISHLETGRAKGKVVLAMR